MIEITLGEFIKLLKRQDKLDEQLTRFENKMYSVRISELSDMPKGGSSDFDVMTDGVQRLEELRQELEDVQCNIDEVTNGLDAVEIDLIRCRYLDDLTWKETCKCIGRSQRHAIRIHKKILGKFKKNVYMA